MKLVTGKYTFFLHEGIVSYFSIKITIYFVAILK